MLDRKNFVACYFTIPFVILVVFLWTLKCEEHKKFRGIPPFKKREDLGTILEQEGKKVGVELGVQKGKFAEKILRQWKSCEQYMLVDLWKAQNNYMDVANINDDGQERNFKETMLRMKQFEKHTLISKCRDYTTKCTKVVKDDYFDFVYVDARHDYLGVRTDLIEWWPKLKDGGLFCGHDFVTSDEIKWTKQDWSINFDGTRDPQGRAVKGAVLEFADMVGRQVVISYREGNWNTWCVRK